MSEVAPVASIEPAATSAGSSHPAPALSAPGAGETKPASPPPAPKTYTLKISGAERQVSEQAYHAYAQKAAAADQMLAEAKRDREAAATERQTLKERFGKDWRGALTEAGHDPDVFLRQAILDRYGQAELTPEQKALQAEQTARRAAEEKLGKFEQERLTQQQQQDHAQAKTRYQESFTAALEATGLGGDPESPLTVWAIRHMATLEEANLDAGTQLPPAVLAEMVNEDLAQQHLAVFGTLEGDALLARLGPDISKRVGKALVADYQKRQAGAPAQAQVPTQAPVRAGLAQPVTLPRNPTDGKFVSREERRGSERLFAAFIPASVTG